MHDIVADGGKAAVDMPVLTAFGAEMAVIARAAIGAGDRAGGVCARFACTGLDRAAQQSAFDRSADAVAQPAHCPCPFGSEWG